jgi:peptidoglycan/xylan/chitin deacetylase (PgdA/CDA1 family)
MVQTLKNAVKHVYSRSLWHSGALAAWLRLRPGRHHPWILNYHHIPPEPFESHLRCLAGRYHVVTLDACTDHVVSGAPLPPNSVVLTFDDGFAQIHDELYPLLCRYEVPATVFLPTTPVDTGHPLWFNRVKTFIRTVEADAVTVGDRTVPLANGREAAYVAAVNHLNEQSVAERDRMIDAMLDGVELPPDRMARYRPLTWDQVKAMRGLVTYGGHTRTHPYLGRLGRAEAEDEILGSKARLEEVLGEPVRHFSYPFGGPGSFTDETEAIVEAGGFVSAVTTTRRACRRGDPPYRLPRILFDGSVDGPMVAARLSGLWLFLTT